MCTDQKRSVDIITDVFVAYCFILLSNLSISTVSPRKASTSNTLWLSKNK